MKTRQYDWLLILVVILYGIIEYLWQISFGLPPTPYYHVTIGLIMFTIAYFVIRHFKHFSIKKSIFISVIAMICYSVLEDLVYYIMCSLIGDCSFPKCLMNPWREQAYGVIGKIAETPVPAFYLLFPAPYILYKIIRKG